MKSLDCVEIEVSKAKIKMSVVKIQYSGILMNARDTFLEKNNIIKSIIAVVLIMTIKKAIMKKKCQPI